MFVGVSTKVYKFDSDGNEVWQSDNLAGLPRAMSVSSDGDVIANHYVVVCANAEVYTK